MNFIKNCAQKTNKLDINYNCKLILSSLTRPADENTVYSSVLWLDIILLYVYILHFGLPGIPVVQEHYCYRFLGIVGESNNYNLNDVCNSGEKDK